MDVRGLMDIQPGKPLYVYIVNMKAERVNLPKFMKVAYASTAPTCIIHASDDEPHIMTDEDPISTK